jgi:hypothetical protein
MKTKVIKVVFGIIITSVIISCKNSKEAATNNSTTPNRTTSLERPLVTFWISPCS